MATEENRSGSNTYSRWNADIENLSLSRRQSVHPSDIFALHPEYCCSGEPIPPFTENPPCDWKGSISLKTICEKTQLHAPKDCDEVMCSNLLDIAGTICVLSKDSLSWNEKRKLLREEFHNTGLKLNAKSIASAIRLVLDKCTHVKMYFFFPSATAPEEFLKSWEKYAIPAEIERAWTLINNREPEKEADPQDAVFGPGFMEGIAQLLPEGTPYIKVEPNKGISLLPPGLLSVRFVVFIVPPDMEETNFCQILDILSRLLSSKDGRILVCSPLCLDLWKTMDEKDQKCRTWISNWNEERKTGGPPSVICIGEENDKNRYYHRAGESLRKEITLARLAVYANALNEELLQEGFHTVFAGVKEVDEVRRQAQFNGKRGGYRGGRGGYPRGGRPYNVPSARGKGGRPYFTNYK